MHQALVVGDVQQDAVVEGERSAPEEGWPTTNAFVFGEGSGTFAAGFRPDTFAGRLLSATIVTSSFSERWRCLAELAGIRRKQDPFHGVRHRHSGGGRFDLERDPPRLTEWTSPMCR